MYGKYIVQIIVLVGIIPSLYTKVIFNDKTYSSGQLTSYGFDDRSFEPITGTLVLESQLIGSCNNIILLSIGADETYSDDIIFKHIDKGCLGTIIVGVSEIYPGDSVNNMRNNREFSYPAVGITYPDFESILKDLMMITNHSVTINGELGDNMWKTLGLTSIILTMIIMNGIFCSFFIIWNSKTLQIIFSSGKQDSARVTITTTIINIVHNVIRIVGLINYNGFYQLYDSIAASIISSFAPPILFIACWINGLIMHQIVNRNNLKINNFLNSKTTWPFIVCSILVLVSDIVLNGLYSIKFGDPLSPLYISIARILVTCLLTLSLSIVYIVGSAFILKSLKSNPIPSKRRTSLIRKSSVNLFVMSGLLFSYCIGVAAVFIAFQDPYSTIGVYLFLNIIISCISGMLSFNNYSVIRGRIYSASSSLNRNSSSINNSSVHNNNNL